MVAPPGPPARALEDVTPIARPGRRQGRVRTRQEERGPTLPRMPEPPLERQRSAAHDGAPASHVGEQIRHARLEAGMTQQQLSQGRYTKAYISALELGLAQPSMASLNFISGRLGLPPSRFLADSAITWRRISADLLLASGKCHEAVEAYRELLGRTVERGARAELLRGLAEGLCRLEQADAAVAPGAEAVELFTALGRPGDAALASYWLARAQFLLDNRAEARALLRGLLRELRTDAGAADADPDLLLRTLGALGAVETACEDHPAALAHLVEARAWAGDFDDMRRAALLSLAAANHAAAGDLEGAIRAATGSLALFRAADARRESATLENSLAVAYLQVGELDRAAQLAALARARHEADRDRRLLAQVAETEAQIALAQGRPEDAIRLAGEAIGHAEASANTRALTGALLTTARAQAAGGSSDDAAAAYGRAIDVLRRVGPVARLQGALGEWAEILASLGRHEEAYALTHEALGVARRAHLDARIPAAGTSRHRDPVMAPAAPAPVPGVVDRHAPAPAPVAARSPRRSV